jgi:hypothetical protein
MSTRSKHTAPKAVALLSAILLPNAALSIALLAPPSIARAEAPEALLLATPAAPSHCKQTTTKAQDGEGHTWYFSFVSWTDNSTNEDGFTVETWRNQPGPGGWVLAGSQNRPANSTGAQVPAGQGYKFRVKAFNASGDSAWSNWAH